ncbi:serine hydrolase [Actinomadura opuntiae]|uniref:serine hydrolase n=1 Tax=Actinomadura sp. OS1-43 TaxID=604315 RepID=UPI00255B11F3|nr:serine hydrolase [Actinomadura sp. OS1-43]MDL4815828.1 serine hydrolase [Actinomadura sp. OS1-43]
MRPIALLVAAIAGAAAILAAGSSVVVRETVPSRAPAPSPTGSPMPAPSSPPAFGRSERAALTRALDRYLDRMPGDLSVSVREVGSGLGYTYNGDLRTATASIVKVDIVIALLLRAQREKRVLTAAERMLAEKAIRISDNDAASALWNEIGGASGLAAANRRIGLRDTTPGTGGAWGSTTTGAADQVRLLASLVSGRSPLHASARRYLRKLMADVTSEQAWGVSAAAGDGAEVALKNGWLPREIHGGRWTVNSIGLVRDAGRLFLVAAVSERDPTLEKGIAAVEHACASVVAALARATSSGRASQR